jgi:ribosomal protein L7/L12
MLRVLLIALAVLFALRAFARLASPRGPAPSMAQGEPRAKKPSLSDAQRAELEAERERALREGRQIDAIKIHRQLTGLGLTDAKRAVDEMRQAGTRD